MGSLKTKVCLSLVTAFVRPPIILALKKVTTQRMVNIMVDNCVFTLLYNSTVSRNKDHSHLRTSKLRIARTQYVVLQMYFQLFYHKRKVSVQNVAEKKKRFYCTRSLKSY